MKPPILYRDYSTAHPVTGQPALDHYHQLVDLLEMADNLPQIEDVERLANIAELEYAGKWARYSGPMGELITGRMNAIAGQLLKAA